MSTGQHSAAEEGARAGERVNAVGEQRPETDSKPDRRGHPEGLRDSGATDAIHDIGHCAGLGASLENLRVRDD